MSKGSNPTNVTTTTSAEPSEFIRPYFQQAIDYGQDLFESQTPQFFPEATYTGFAPQTETALQLAQARAIQGNPLLGSAQGEVNKILQGDYLSPTSNPFLQNVANQVADNVTSQVQSQFSRAGRLGSGANQEILAKQLADAQNRLFSDNFAAERQRQFDAVQLAPSLGQADYDDIAQLGQVGAAREDLEMAKLQDAIARFDFEQQRPFLKLREYLGTLGANVPTTTVSTQPVFRNTGAGILGGALTGGKIAGQIGGSSMFGNPLFGAAAGGLLGGFY
jgi:hypothetical protein